jgi:hypothetical protein
VSNKEIKSVNTKGYFKHGNNIEKLVENSFLENGGIFVKTDDISKIYIHKSALDLFNKIIINHFNVIE